MKIMICTTLNTLGGLEESALEEALATEFKKCGNTVDTYRLPYVSDIIDLPEQILAYRLIAEPQEADMLITIGYPACFARHRNKVSFLFDMEPKIKELFKTIYGAMDDRVYINIAEFLKTAEKKALQETKMIYCSSKTLKNDITNRFGVRSESFSIGVNIEGNEAIENCIATQSNLESADRIELIMDAISQTDNKLVIYVPHAEEMILRALRIRMQRMGIENQIEIIERPMGKQAIASAKLIIATPIMTRRIPGYVIEAIRASTPVIVTQDSDALLEVIHHEKEGYVARAEKDEIARFMKRVKLPLKNKSRIKLNTEKQIEEIVKGLM